MTILPKKKHQEGKKSETDFVEEVRSRGRVRTTRDRARPSSSEHSGNIECPVSSALSASSPRYDYNEVEKRESSDCSSVPYKRTRHRPVGATGKFLMGPNDGGRAASSRRINETEEGEDGYNSSDEHGPCELDPDIAKKEETFEKELREKKGFIIKKMVPDGACLFRAVADQVYGDQEMHSIVRNHCMDYMMKNADYFSKFVTEDFTSYIHRKKNDYCHGNNVEIQALSEMYNRPIEIYVYSLQPMNTFLSQSHQKSDENPPIRLSYHGNVHYNSVVDPYAPTVGVGLGLAGYKPGLADRMLLSNVIRTSEEQVLEEEMLKDKLKATDWEATDETLTEIVAKESYLQWLKENQRRHKPPSSTGSSATASASSSQSRRSPPHEQPSSHSSASGYSPRSPRSGKSNSQHVTSSDASPQRPDAVAMAHSNSRNPSVRSQEFGLTEGAAAWDGSSGLTQEQDFSGWGDDRIIAAVLARSQQEYYEQLSNTSGGHRKVDN